MTTTLEVELKSKIDELEAKSKRIRSAKNVESKLTSARNSIKQLNRELDSLEETANELAFYVEILETVFDGERPSEVEQAISTAQRTADIDDEDVLDAAGQQDFSDLFNAVQKAEGELEGAIDQVDERITQNYQSPWVDELSSARDLNRIIGGGDDKFLDIISSMKSFLSQAIWDSTNVPQTLSARWERLLDEWEANSGKHGWESFREEHGLSGKTIKELKQFTTKDTVRLSDLSLTTLKEVKQVDELESALQVELKS